MVLQKVLRNSLKERIVLEDIKVFLCVFYCLEKMELKD